MNLSENKGGLYLINQDFLNEISIIRQDVANIKLNLNKKEEDISSAYVESKKIPEALGICDKTWQNWRKSGKIPFIQFGSKIWVKRSDLDLFLERHYVKQSA